MATPVVTGTPAQVDISAGSGSTSVTAPADATGALAYWSHWDNNAGSRLSSLSFAGGAFVKQSEKGEGDLSDASGCGVAILTPLPATGAQTLSWAWTAGGARSEGGVLVIVWVKGLNTGDVVRDAATNQQTGSTIASASVASTVNDLVVGMAQKFDGDPALTAATILVDNFLVNSEHMDVGVLTAGASSTTCTHTTPDYSNVAVISLKPTGGTTSKSGTDSGSGADTSGLGTGAGGGGATNLLLLGVG